MRNDIINTDLAINDPYMSERNTKVIADSASELLESDLDSMTEAGLIRGGRRRREKQREKYREALRKRIDIMENSENVSSFENGQMHYGSEPDDANSKFGKMADKVLSKTIRSSYNVDDREDDSLFGFINRDLGGKFKNEAELLEYWRRNEFVGTDENGKPKLTGGLTDDEIRNRLNEYANRYGEYLQSMSKEEYNRRFINPVVDALNSLEKVLNGYGAGDRFNGAKTDLSQIGSDTSDAGFKTNSDFWRYLGFIYNGPDATKQPYEMKYIVPMNYGHPKAVAISNSSVNLGGKGAGNGNTDPNITKNDKVVTDVNDTYDGNWIFPDKDKELFRGNAYDGIEDNTVSIFQKKNGNYTGNMNAGKSLDGKVVRGLSVEDLDNPMIQQQIAKSFRDVKTKYGNSVPPELSRYGSYDSASESWLWVIPVHKGDVRIAVPFIYRTNSNGDDLVSIPSRKGNFSTIINELYQNKNNIYNNTRDIYSRLIPKQKAETPKKMQGGGPVVKGEGGLIFSNKDDVAPSNQSSSANGSSSTTTTSDGKVVDADYKRQFDERVKAEEEFNDKHPYLRIARFFQLAGDLVSIFVPNPALGAASVALGSVLDGFDPNVTKGQLLENLGLGAISLVNPLSKLARISKRAPEIIMGLQKVAAGYGLKEGVTTLIGKVRNFFEDYNHGVGIKDAFTANFSPQDLTLILSGLRGFTNTLRTSKTAKAVNEKLTGDKSGAAAVPSNRIKEVYGDAVYKDKNGQNRSQPVSVSSSNFKSQEVSNGVNSMANKYNNAYEKQTGRPGDVTIETPPVMKERKAPGKIAEFAGKVTGSVRSTIAAPKVANAAKNLDVENNVTYNPVIKQNESSKASQRANKLIEERNKEVENRNSGSIKLDKKKSYNVEPTQPFVFDANGNPRINKSTGGPSVPLKEGMYYQVDGRSGRIVESPFESNASRTIYSKGDGNYSLDPNGSSTFKLDDNQASRLRNFGFDVQGVDSKQDGGELTRRLKAVNDWNDYARNNPWYISSSTESQTYEGQPIGGDGRYHDNNIENLRDFARGFFDRNPGYKELLGIDDVDKWAYDIVNHKIYPNDVNRGDKFYAPIINFDEEGNMSYSQNSSDPNYNINNNVSGIPGPAFPNVGTYSNVSDGSKSAQPIAQGTSNGSAQSATQGASAGSIQTTSTGANASVPNENGSSGNASANGQPSTSLASGSESANQSAAVGANTNPASAAPTGQTAQGQVKSGNLSSIGDNAVTGNDNGTDGSNAASNNAEGVNPSGNGLSGTSDGGSGDLSASASAPVSDKTNDAVEAMRRAMSVAHPVNTEFYGYRKGIFNPLWVTRPLPSALNASTNTLLNAEADKNRMTLMFPGNDKQKTVRVEGDYEGLQEARDNFARMRESLSDYVSTDMAKNIDNYNNITYNGIGMVHQAEAADRGAFRQSREKALSDIDNNRNSMIESGNVNEKILTDELNRRNAIDYEAAANVRDNMYNAVEDVKDRFVHLRSIYNYLYADEDAKAIAARQIENREKLKVAMNDAAVQIAKNVSGATGRTEQEVMDDLVNGNAGYLRSHMNGETSYLYNTLEYLRKQYDKIKNRNFESEAKRSILSTVPGSLNTDRYFR